MDKPIGRNAFDALCSLASEEQWCWKINCTTCGHMHFRYALRELLRGSHPDSSSWAISKKHPELSRGSQPQELGTLPPRWESWPLEDQHSLLQVLVGANVRNIRSTCTYPDWLGYLGLGLMYSRDAEQATRTLTKAWTPQLLEERMGARSQSVLQTILANEDVLTWHHLESLEWG